MAESQTPPARQQRHWLPFLALAVVLMLLLALWIVSPSQTDPGAKKPEPPQVSHFTPPVPSVSNGTASHQSDTPVAAPPSRMLALSLQFQNGRLIETGRQEFAGDVRSRRGMDGQRGLYHRIVDPAGKVLFENLVADPTHVPYDTTDDGKTLRGGQATLSDLPLQLRLPIGIAGKLEVYRMESGRWTRSALPTDAQHLVGTFDLR